MKVLGLETSTAVCGVALVDENGLLSERSMVEARVHSEKILTLIREAVAEAQVELRSLDAVAVSIGPGSFTGLRIGLSTAKGLCYALDKPIVAVPTFDAVARAVFKERPNNTELIVLADARQGEWYGAGYVRNNGGVEVRRAVHVVPQEHVLSLLGTRAAASVVLDDKKALAGVHLEDALEFHHYCRASTVAEIGFDRARAGTFSNLQSLEPMYLKDFVARMAAGERR
jgi:tRNA threonylcarbamoyladenosine biosynthesis protein TsaB